MSAPRSRRRTLLTMSPAALRQMLREAFYSGVDAAAGVPVRVLRSDSFRSMLEAEFERTRNRR